MGVNTKFLVVRGFYFGDSAVEELGEDRWEELLDTDRVILVSPMDNPDFIIGDVLIESNDGRYEPLDFHPFRFEDLCYSDRDKIFQKVPEELKGISTNDKFGTYCFIRYS